MCPCTKPDQIWYGNVNSWEVKRQFFLIHNLVITGYILLSVCEIKMTF